MYITKSEFFRRIKDSEMYKDIISNFAGRRINIPTKKTSKSLLAYEMLKDGASLPFIVKKLHISYSLLNYIGKHLKEYKKRQEKIGEFRFVFGSYAQKLINTCGGCQIKIPFWSSLFRAFILEKYEKQGESPKNIAQDLMNLPSRITQKYSKKEVSEQSLIKEKREFMSEKKKLKNKLTYVRRVIKQFEKGRESHLWNIRNPVEKCSEAKKMDTFFGQKTKEKKKAIENIDESLYEEKDKKKKLTTDKSSEAIFFDKFFNQKT